MPPTNHEVNSIKSTVAMFLHTSKSFLPLEVKSLEITEDLENDISRVSYVIALNGTEVAISGTGEGVVDALFRSMIQQLSKDYPSLEQIRLSEFHVKAKIKNKRKSIGSDAPVKVELVVENASHIKIPFSHEAKSLNNAACKAVIKTVEYFINCEVAIIKLKKCILDAKDRNRSDLLEKYTLIMSEIVKNMSYKNILTQSDE